jgi:type II secretory pathway component GspD/PulD (secretin)
MKALRALILLCALCALCGVLMWQLLGPGSAAQEAATGLTDSTQVWVEATFIQIDTSELDGVQMASGKTLDPAQGQILLDGTEKAELLAELKKQASSEVLGSASLATLSGRQALMQMVEEVRYPTEYEAETAESETADGKTTKIGPPVVLPRKFEEREVGIRLNVTPTVSPDGKSVTLVLTPEVSFPAGWVNFGSQTFTQPVFSSWNLTTTLQVPDGSTLALIGVPTKNFEQSYLLSPQLGQKLKGAKSSVLLISAKIIKAKSD